MSAYADARRYLGADLDRFEEKLQAVLDGQHEYLSATERDLYRSGKRLRPILFMRFPCKSVLSKA